jgi:hypothetical protein
MKKTKKKTFINKADPAMQFIRCSPPATTDVRQKRQINPVTRRESKSKHLHILIKPSLHARLEEIATAKGTSLNDCINIGLESFASRPMGKSKKQKTS